MPEVPSQEQDPESERPPEAAALPPASPPPDEPERLDVALTPPPPPFARPSAAQRGAAAAGDQPAEPSAAPGPPRPEAPWFPPGPPSGFAALPPASTGPPPLSGGAPVDAGASSVTTGVPHFSPPAPPPPWPSGPSADAAGAGDVALPAPPKKRRSLLRPLGRGLRELAETVILALLIFLLVRAVVQNFQVEGKSMEPTFQSGWYLLVNKALYWEINLETVNKFLPFVDPGDDPTRYIFRGPTRGDVIVFENPNSAPGDPERDFIKRIIGLPGETVEVRDCTVFIDGKALDEPYVNELPNYTYGPETVPEGHYFVLGDNRNNSSDSHSWGPLPKEKIIGQAWLTYWPFDAFGLVDNTSVTPQDVAAEGTSAGKPAAVCASAGG